MAKMYDGGRKTPEGMTTYGAAETPEKMMGSKGKVPTGLENSTIGDKMAAAKRGSEGPDKYFPHKSSKGHD